MKYLLIKLIRTFIAIYFAMNMSSIAAEKTVTTENPAYRDGDRLQKSPALVNKLSDYKETLWDSLIPADWNPEKLFQNLNMDTLSDADPRAMEVLKKVKDAWDNAPVEQKLNGAKIRIPGFVVPLEGQHNMISEFLLVPYFGACIHTPPPPANQIIRVFTKNPLKNAFVMDAVWVSGTLETTRSQSSMGEAGYTLRAERITPYRGK